MINLFVHIKCVRFISPGRKDREIDWSGNSCSSINCVYNSIQSSRTRRNPTNSLLVTWTHFSVYWYSVSLWWNANLAQKRNNLLTPIPSGLVHIYTSTLLSIYLKCADSFVETMIQFWQERSKFGTIGWNAKYDFNEFDYETSVKVLSSFLQSTSCSFQPGFNWKDLKFLIGEVSEIT